MISSVRCHGLGWAVLMLCLSAMTGCNALHIIHLMNRTEVEVKTYQSSQKEIRFLGMAHVGQPEFYIDVQRQVEVAKKQGFALYYEFVDFDTASDTELRKIRKLFGIVPTLPAYAKLLESWLDDGYVVQNNSLFLGLVNDSDFRVDLTGTELLAAYEHKYGSLVLTEEDKTTPLDQPVHASEPVSQMKAIALDYRNHCLAAQIQASHYSRIIVLYGAEHEEGLLAELRRLDPSWKPL